MAEQILTCPECGGTMVLKESQYGPLYGCTRWPDCDCSHGAHPNGDPLGVPANKATRLARMEAHDAFDVMRLATGRNRSDAYRWLQDQMGMTREQCHMGKFDIDICKLVVEVCERASAAKGFIDPWAKNPAEPHE